MARLPDAAGRLGNAGNAGNAGNEGHEGNTTNIRGVREITEMPVKALRSLFSGIGQLLLAADRFRTEEAQRAGVAQDQHDGPQPGMDGEHAAEQMTTADYVRSAEGPGEAATSARGRHRKPAGATTGSRAGTRKKRRGESPGQFRSLDSTGNVRLLTPDMPAESTSQADRRTAKAQTAKTKRVPEQRRAAELPVPGYDGRSVASLRSRLRNLDARQVRILLEHERSAANRSDVVAMFERRIAKLEAGPDAS
jgi:hypothetical protein